MIPVFSPRDETGFTVNPDVHLSGKTGERVKKNGNEKMEQRRHSIVPKKHFHSFFQTNRPKTEHSPPIRAYNEPPK